MNVLELWEQAHKVLFQFIYARDMFLQVHRPGHEAGGFDSYMRGECFAYGDNTLDNAVVSTYICAGNVSAIRLDVSKSGFNSYMRGKCFLPRTRNAVMK